MTGVSAERQNRLVRLPRRQHRRRLVIAVGTVAALFCVATGWLLVWPRNGMPAHVDAIVMLNGSGDRLPTALELARAHHASVLAISYWPPGTACAPPVPGVKIICFAPSPRTTQGEAEYAARLARHYHWRSMVLVTTAPQNTRARLRFGRCFGGEIYAVDAPLAVIHWPYTIAYEWAALVKALVFQRSC